jgi:outer membrane protein OmpA-like peptidoglycan-associated protein
MEEDHVTQFLQRFAPLTVLLLAGCGGLPERVDSVEQARETIGMVERESLAGRVAATELAAAREALASAGDTYEERAEADRNRIIAEARTREAEAAAQAAEGATRELDVQTRATEEQARAEQAAAERNRQLEQELADLHAESTDRGLVLTLGDVLFDTGAATLKPGAATTIDRLTQFMRDYPERAVRIEGHTDAVGSDALNQDLSERRAQAVRDALMTRGLESERIGTLGLGETRPIVGNDSPGGRQQNRRVEIVVSDESGEFGDDDSRRAQV